MSLLTTNAPSKQDASPNLLTLQQTAKKLGCSVQTVSTLTKSGQLPRIQIGSIIRIDPRDLEKFIESRKLST